MFDRNNFYGQQEILCEYAGIKMAGVRAMILHSTGFPRHEAGLYKLDDVEKKMGEVLLCYSTGQKDAFSQQTTKPVHIIQHPFTIVDKYTPVQYGMREGTVFFPEHSTPKSQWKNDQEVLVSWLKKNCEPPITVCMGAVPMQYTSTDIYTKAGFSITTAGPRDSSFFYHRLRAILCRHTYACSNVLSSPMVLAQYLGIPFQYVPIQPVSSDGKETYLPADLVEKYSEPLLDKRFARSHLGYHHWREKETMAILLKGNRDGMVT